MQIIARLESLRRREHEATVALIETLVECQRTRAYADAGYDSVWKLLVARLGYSPAAASRRVAAMRCVMKCPRALDMLRARRTTLSALHTIAKTLLDASDPNVVLEEIDGASHVEVERAVARRRVVAKPVERVRRKVVAAPPRTDQAMTLARATPAATSSDAELPIDESAIDDRATAEPVLEERVQLTLSLSAADFERLEEAKRRLSGKYPKGMTLEQLFLELLAVSERKHEPKPRRAKATRSGSRHVPAATRRAVLARDHVQCTFVAPDGTRCGSRHDLEIDHVVPWARGGGHDPSNLRVLCATHNRRRAELQFGPPPCAGTT